MDKDNTYNMKNLLKGKINLKNHNINFSYSVLPSSYSHTINNNSIKSNDLKSIEKIYLKENKNYRKIKIIHKTNNIKKTDITNNNIPNNSKDKLEYNSNYFTLEDTTISNSNIKHNHCNRNKKRKEKMSKLITDENNIQKTQNISHTKKNNTSKSNTHTKENTKINLIKRIKIDKENLKILKNIIKNKNRNTYKNINSTKSFNSINTLPFFPSTINNNTSIQNNKHLTVKNLKVKKNDSIINQRNIYENYRNNSQLRNKRIVLDFIDKRNSSLKSHNNFSEIGPTVKNEQFHKSYLNRNNKIKNINYIKNKKLILSSIEKEKQKLIDESFKNYQKYLYLIQKQQKEYKEYDQFLKKELKNNKNNQLQLQIVNNNLKKGGTQSYFNLLSKNNNLTPCSTKKSVEEKNKLSTNNFFFYNNNSTINKSIQKYFLLKADNSENRMSKFNKAIRIKNRNNTFNDFTESKLILSKELINIDEIKKNIKDSKKTIKLNINNVNKDKKIYNIEKKNLKIKNNISDNISGYYNNNQIKTPNAIKKKKAIIENIKTYDNSKTNVKVKNKVDPNKIQKRLILKNMNFYRNCNTHKDLALNPQKLFPNNKNNIPSNNSNHKSLSKLQELNDYIGPNQYGCIIIPNSNKKTYRKISEEKERALNKLKNIFKFQENLRNNEYYSQTKNRKIDNIDEYYKKKDFEKIILSSEKKSKYSKIKNEIYNTAFKPCKYEGNNKK